MNQLAPAFIALIIVAAVSLSSRRTIRIAGAEPAERIDAVN